MGRSENLFHPPVGLPPTETKQDFNPSEPPLNATAGDIASREVQQLAFADGRERSSRRSEGASTGRDPGTTSGRLPVAPVEVPSKQAGLPDLIIVNGEGNRPEYRTVTPRDGSSPELRAVATVRDLGANVVFDDNKQISKISYPAENKTREFGRDENGEINKLVTTTPRGQFSYVKEDGRWLYLAPDHKKYVAPDFSLDDNGEFSKSTADGVVLTQRPDGRLFNEERTALGARIQRDVDGNPVTVKRPDNTSITATYECGRLAKLVDSQDGASITWTPDGKGNWRSDDVPPQTVQNMRLEHNGNLSYTSDKSKYTIRGNGAEIEENATRSRYTFDDQGRISSIKYPGGKAALSFGYLGSDDKPSFIQVDDLQKHESKRFIHQPDKGGWTGLDRNNNLLGTWKGAVKLSDDGSYAIKPAVGNSTTYLPDGTTRTEQAKATLKPVDTPETEKPETRRPEVRRPEVRRPEVRRPEVGRPEVRSPETDKPETRKPETRKPETERPPATPDVQNENEITDHSFQLKGYMLPSPDQLGAGSCLYMSATGIAEYLINKSKGIVNPQVGGATDLSEQWTINLSKTVQLGNNYTDAPELLARAGALPDSRMKFRAYASSSWMSEPAIGGRGTEALPPFKKDVLFNGGGEGSQNAHGQMRPADLERIKKYLRENQSPVLFVYKPPTANWWHANIITGYDDKTQSFTVRDSSFGRQVSNAPAYNYDGRSPYGPKPYRNETQMPYYQVLQWGNHATGYKLAN
ncbi:MAG: hypothetical protein JST89_11815 [Cyanobacteria bacterium SZAS-4]|nr:hypothetical protein [Cyanobacteria bacterium SZAS-4]